MGKTYFGENRASPRPNPSQFLCHFDLFKGNRGCSCSPDEFCGVPGISGCFSLQRPREAPQEPCPFFPPSTKNCSEQNFPSIHPAPLRDSLDFSGLSSFPLFCFPGIFSFPCLNSWSWGTIISCRAAGAARPSQNNPGEHLHPQLFPPKSISLEAEGTLVPARPSFAKPRC